MHRLEKEDNTYQTSASFPHKSLVLTSKIAPCVEPFCVVCAMVLHQDSVQVQIHNVDSLLLFYWKTPYNRIFLSHEPLAKRTRSVRHTQQ